MHRRLRTIGPVLGAALFILAVVVLQHQLLSLRYVDIVQSLRHIPHPLIVLSGALVALDYALLTGYDALALRYLSIRLPYRKTSLASFLCYAIGHNLGLPVLSGGTVRFRVYSSYGLDVQAITKIIAFTTLTYWMGFLTTAGFVFPLIALPAHRHGHPLLHSLHLLGWIFLGIGVLYVIRPLLIDKAFSIGRIHFPKLSFSFTCGQVAICSMELVVSSSILFVLIQNVAAVSFPVFFGIFLLSQISGLASQIPGGLGVFESMVLFLLPRNAIRSQVFAGLVLYRILFYILPLLLAILLLGYHEFVKQYRKHKANDY